MQESKLLVQKPVSDTRNIILEAARLRIARYGPDGLRIAHIAKDAGVSHPLILHHFRNREGLITALVELAATRAASHLHAIVSLPDLSPTSIEGLLFELAIRLDEEGDAELLAWALRKRPAQAEPMLAQMLSQCVEHIDQLRTTPPTSRAINSQTRLWVAFLACFLLGDGLLGRSVARAVPLSKEERFALRPLVASVAAQVLV
jgi:TetR/AcrR family transcriptional regulator, repressor for neighboring sulfatase